MDGDALTQIGLFNDLSQESTSQELLAILDQISEALGVLQSVRESNGSLRVYLRGADSISTIATVSTVSNQTSIGGFPANQIVPATQNMVVTLSNINHVEVTA